MTFKVAGILYSPCPWAWHQFGIPPSVVSTVGSLGREGGWEVTRKQQGPPVDSFDFCIFFFCENLGAERHWIVLDEILLLSIMKLWGNNPATCNWFLISFWMSPPSRRRFIPIGDRSGTWALGCVSNKCVGMSMCDLLLMNIKNFEGALWGSQNPRFRVSSCWQLHLWCWRGRGGEHWRQKIALGGNSGVKN